MKKYYDLCILGATAYAAGIGGKSFFKKISFFLKKHLHFQISCAIIYNVPITGA